MVILGANSHSCGYHVGTRGFDIAGTGYPVIITVGFAGTGLHVCLLAWFGGIEMMIGTALCTGGYLCCVDIQRIELCMSEAG